MPPGGVHPPIVKPPVVTIGGINPGTGTTPTTIYAKRNFKPMIVRHLATTNVKTTFARSVVHNIVFHPPTVSRASGNMMVMHSFRGGSHGHR